VDNTQALPTRTTRKSSKMTSPIVASIDKAGLKPGYVIVLFLFSIFAVEFAWRTALGAGLVPADFSLRQLTVRAGAVAVALALFAAIRDLRIATVAMFRAPSVPFRLSDLVLSVAVAYAWCIGVHKTLVILPTVWIDPDYFYPFWNISDAARTWTPGTWILVAAWIGIATPILEEFFFRGMLLNAWMARRTVVAAVLLSSLVFGLTHAHMTLMAWGLGIILAVVYLRHGSLWPAIAVHGVYNVLQIVPGLAALAHKKSFAEAVTINGWRFEIFLAIAFVPLAVLFWRRFKPIDEAASK